LGWFYGNVSTEYVTHNRIPWSADSVKLVLGCTGDEV
jgi:hypothetical protein